MKHKILLFTYIFMVYVSFAPGAMATDVFIKRNKDTGSVDLQEKGHNAPKPSAPQTIGDKANLYYQSCIKQKHPLLKGEMLGLFCGCTSAKMTEVMTPEQITTMGEDSVEGQYQRNRMTLFIYTPCIEYPTKALILDQCLNNKEARKGMRNPKKTCGCLAEGMGKYMREKAPKTIERALMVNAGDIDPLRVLLESPDFDSKTQYLMRACVAEHELGQDLR